MTADDTIPTWKEATDRAYRMASRWGGGFVVVAASEEGPYRVLGDHPGVLADAKKNGLIEMGRAVSHQLGELGWEGGTGVPPPSPFDDLPRPKPPTLVAHLTPELRELASWMFHIVHLQRVFGHSRQVWQLLDDKSVQQLPPDAPVPFERYLAMVERIGKVAQEIARLKDTLARADQAYDRGRGRDAAERILHGGKSEPDNPGDTPAY